MKDLRGIEFRNLAGAKLIQKFGTGSSPTVTTRSTWYDSTTKNQPLDEAAIALEIVSSSANDTAAGTGARTVLVEGVTATFDYLAQTVSLAGATPVALDVTFMRINQMTVQTAGSGEVNAGNIDVRAVAGGVVRNRIQVQHGSNNDLRYTVPLGKKAYVYNLFFGAMGNNTNPAIAIPDVSFLGWIGKSTGALPGNVVFRLVKRFIAYGGGCVERNWGYLVELPEKACWDPVVQNNTDLAALWTADQTIVEFPAVL